MSNETTPAPLETQLPPISPTRQGLLTQFFAPIIEGKTEVALILTGLLLVLIVQWMQVFPDPVQTFSPAALTAGVIIILMGIHSARSARQPGIAVRFLVGAGNKLGISANQVVFLFLGVVLSLLAAISIDYGPKLRAPVITIGVWLLSILLVLLGGWQLGNTRWPARRTLLIAFALTLLAFVPRGLLTERIPALFTSDEAAMGLNAVAFIKGEANNLFNVGSFSFPAFFYFLESFSIRLLGQTIPALRLFAATAGAITVGTVYLITRAMFGQSTALLATIFLTGFHFHIHFSRLGLNNIWDGLAYTIAMGALWVGWQRGQRGYFLLAGAAIGFAQYFYASARLLVVLIPIWVLFAGFFDRERLRRAVPGLVIMVITALVIVAPLAWFYFNNQNEFWAPFQRVSITTGWLEAATEKTGDSAWLIIAQQVWVGIRGYTSENLRFFYAPNTPMLRPFSSIFFIIGVAMLVFRPTDSRHSLLVLWLLGFGVISGLSIDPPTAQRYVAAAPAVAILLAFGLNELTTVLAEMVPKATVTFSILALIVVLGLTADDLRFYFLDYSPRTAETLGNDLVANRLAHYLETKPSGTQVYFFGAPRMGFQSHLGVPFLASQVDGFDMSPPWNPSLLDTAPGTLRIFVFLPEYQTTISEVQTSYPGGKVYEEFAANDHVLYTIYEGEW